MDGVERYKVRLMSHRQSWKIEFSKVKKELQNVWDDNIIDIQHVGSTAVPAIFAKPILDIAVQLQSIQSMNTERLKELGYDYCGSQHGNTNCHLFVLRGENEISLRHIHCFDKDEKEFYLQVGFRDYLNTHIDVAIQYENLKKELAAKYPNDRIAYTLGKEQFIQLVYKML